MEPLCNDFYDNKGRFNRSWQILCKLCTKSIWIKCTFLSLQLSALLTELIRKQKWQNCSLLFHSAGDISKTVPYKTLCGSWWIKMVHMVMTTYQAQRTFLCFFEKFLWQEFNHCWLKKSIQIFYELHNYILTFNKQTSQQTNRETNKNKQSIHRKYENTRSK